MSLILQSYDSLFIKSQYERDLKQTIQSQYDSPLRTT